MRVRLATYNVHSFRAGVHALAAPLAEEALDVVLVQECGSRRAVRRFAGALGMEALSSHRPFNRVRNAVLFRPPWRLVGVAIRDLSRMGRALRRGFILVHLRQGGALLSCMSLHLGLAPRERQAHVRELTDYLAGIQGPIVVGADLNEPPDGVAARWMAGRLFDAFAQAGEGAGETFPAGSPSARIDYLFVSQGVRVLRAWVGDSSANQTRSDHHPVLAVVNIAEP